MFKCQSCFYSTVLKSNLTRHVKQHVKVQQGTFKCIVCEFQTFDSSCGHGAQATKACTGCTTRAGARATVTACTGARVGIRARACACAGACAVIIEKIIVLQVDMGLKRQKQSCRKQNFFKNLLLVEDTEGILQNPPICLYKLHLAVEARGGFDNLTEIDWHCIAISCSVRTTPIEKLMAIYSKFLLAFESQERERLRYLKQKSAPYWWDYDDYLCYRAKAVPIPKKRYHATTKVNTLMEIYDKYFLPNYGNVFPIKDTWLYVTSLTPKKMLQALESIKNKSSIEITDF